MSTRRLLLRQYNLIRRRRRRRSWKFKNNRFQVQLLFGRCWKLVAPINTHCISFMCRRFFYSGFVPRSFFFFCFESVDDNDRHCRSPAMELWCPRHSDCTQARLLSQNEEANRRENFVWISTDRPIRTLWKWIAVIASAFISICFHYICCCCCCCSCCCCCLRRTKIIWNQYTHCNQFEKRIRDKCWLLRTLYYHANIFSCFDTATLIWYAAVAAYTV